MKLSDKFSPSQLRAPIWDLYDQCSEAIGVILDNKFRDPHITVYEHTRHTPSEVFRQSDDFGTPLPLLSIGANGLAKEENEILETLLASEVGRRLNIVGDVGVGKTTFIKHLIAVHLGTPDFCATQPIYIDFADFSASLTDPLIEIRRTFVDTVWAALEKLFGLDELQATDDAVFENADIFSTSRAIAHRLAEDQKSAYIVTAMSEALKENSVRFTIERLNALSKDNPNRLLLIIDNIDHLPELALRTLSSFLLQVQLNATPMLIVCMRDHTYLAGFSSYRADKTVPAWYLRLKPPNLRMMLDRRIEHFFPSDSTDPQEKKVSTGAGILRVDRAISKVCRALLRSPFVNQETYDFICNYTNYNLRDLFGNLQRIVGFSGYSSHDRDFFFQAEPALGIGIDECLIALALGDSLMFFSHRSPVFNPYFACQDGSPLDKIVAGRILQLLDNRIDWIPFGALRTLLHDWGYGLTAIDAQIKAMISKDIVWTSTGAPANFTEQSEIRLSYRGHLYARKILRRTVFNYMMSFDVEAPNESHAIYRHHKSEFKAELENFANFAAKFESDAVAYRVLGLAELIYEAENAEVRQLLKKKDMKEFKINVAPRSISVGIMDGLVKFLQKTQQAHGNSWRFMPASTSTLKQVGEVSATYRSTFATVFNPNE